MRAVGNDTYYPELTYEELEELVANDGLIPGREYILIGYYTSYIQPVSGHTIVSFLVRDMNDVTGQGFASSADVGGRSNTLGGVDEYLPTMSPFAYGERLILSAATTCSFKSQVKSLDFPGDIIYYDFTMNNRNGVKRPGFIIRRKDTINNLDLPGDWRTMVWARFRAVIGETDSEMYKIRKWTVNGPTEKGFFYFVDDESMNDNYIRIRCAVQTSERGIWDNSYFATTVPDRRSYFFAADMSSDVVEATNYSNLYADLNAVSYRYTFDGSYNYYYNPASDYNDVNGWNRTTSGLPSCRVPNNPGRATNGGDPNEYIRNIFVDGGSEYALHNNVFYQYQMYATSNIRMSSACLSNTIAPNCSGLTLDSYCVNNIFNSRSYNVKMIGCSNNIFGPGCKDNEFGSQCHNNVLTSGCQSNQLDAGCCRNILVTSLYNEFGPWCHGNALSDGCRGNQFGPRCYGNTLVDSDKNLIGPYCYENVMKFSDANIIGPECNGNTITNVNSSFIKPNVNTSIISNKTGINWLGGD